MALSRQFSLSVELSNLVPLAPLAKAGAGALLNLLRECRDEGYDPVTEEDLAMVFGRNRIDPKFESTFRTAVRHSAVHRISDIAELMLEAGAGPTVRRSLKEPAYFSTVLQLSLLTWTHELNSLAASLAQALDRRSKQSNDPKAPPRYDALKNTLRACREQTSGFMWELIISAVDKKLSPFYPNNNGGQWYEYRPVPLPVLQALLDAFTAVQHLPQATLVRVATFTGVSTIIVWAHHVLGLTVLVDGGKDRIKFGDGPESVYISALQEREGEIVPASAALVNETNDLLFEVVQSIEDVDLQAASRHSVAGYGLWVIEFDVQEPDVIQTLIHTIVASCIQLVEEQWQAAHQDSENSHRGRNIYPSTRRILRVANLMFPGYSNGLEGLASDKNRDNCLLQSEWVVEQLPSTFKGYIEQSKYPEAQKAAKITLHKLSHLLAHMILVLSMSENVEKYPALSLDFQVLKKERWMPFRLPNAIDAFESLTTLLAGRNSPHSSGDVGQASAISCWGWCICLGSIIGDDPSSLFPSLAVLQGVPRREGERKRLIIDGHTSDVHGAKKKNIGGQYDITANPGDPIALESWTRPGQTRYFVAATENAFEVAKVYTCNSVTDPAASQSTTIGFRGMQEVYWDMVHLPACEHPVRSGQTMTLPLDTWAFHGFGRPDLRPGGPNSAAIDYTKCLHGSTHVALTAGNIPARYIMLAGQKFIPCDLEDPAGQQAAKANIYSAQYLRNPDCCLECAINQVTYYRRGRHVGLIL